MKITDVRAIHIAIPLDEPVFFAGGVIKAREYILAVVETSEGISGVGYTFVVHKGAAVKVIIQDILRSLLLGEDPFYTETLWERMYRGTLHEGRRGMIMRAISAVDIALWDIKCKAVNQPLHLLLGGSRDKIPAYASAGIYREGKESGHLAEEMAACVESGFKAVKMKVGLLSAREDLGRVKAVREAIGPDVALMLDATNGWRSAKEAIRTARLFEEYDVFFLEEPVMPDNFSALAQITASLDMPVATGEAQSRREAFRDLIVDKVVDIIQPDVTVVGGISEWLKIAHLAACWDIPMAPHRAPEIHAQLAAATPHCLILESHAPSQQYVVVFDRIMQEPPVCTEGSVQVSRRPGVGLVIDWDSVERFRAS